MLFPLKITFKKPRNPLKPDPTRDGVGKTLANAIVAEFQGIFSYGRNQFPLISIENHVMDLVEIGES